KSRKEKKARSEQSAKCPSALCGRTAFAPTVHCKQKKKKTKAQLSVTLLIDKTENTIWQRKINRKD
ncbi:MAG: hypothetical protein AAF688_15100, partial [Bacteroidota bacterium]